LAKGSIATLHIAEWTRPLRVLAAGEQGEAPIAGDARTRPQVGYIYTA